MNWNDFETNIRESFRELREDNNYFDVTLATDDGYLIEAHKLILSAGSNFFREIFKKTKHPTPFIYLKGIQKVEFEYIVNFLYNGEAYIAQEELNKILEPGQDLQVKGLQNDTKEKIEGNQGMERKDSKVNVNEIDSFNIESPKSIFGSSVDIIEDFDTRCLRMLSRESWA